MAVIALTKPQKLKDAIKKATRQTKIDCLDYGIKNKEIAEVTGVDPSAISHQFKNKNITLATYLAVQLLKTEREEE